MESPLMNVKETAAYLHGREDVWEVIDRVRLDNDIKDPGALKPGRSESRGE